MTVSRVQAVVAPFFVMLPALAAGCGSDSGSDDDSGSGGSGGSSSSHGSGGTSGGSYDIGYVTSGKLTTTGAYEGSWSNDPGDKVLPATDSLSVALTNDKGQLGNLQIFLDGRISLGSADVSTIGADAHATGAQLTLGTGSAKYICGFTINADLMGAPGGAFHISGKLDVIGSDGKGDCY